jgi:CHAT domain-containing protein
VKAIAVLSGIYSNVPGWQRLQQAEDEASEIEVRWNGIHVEAATDPVLKCIKGVPPGDLLHFALHGNYDPNSTLNGLILVDGEALDPTTVKGCNLARTPFVFLNACQVGQGNAVLGDYSGMAAAFLYAGASGVVAPLWSIKDTIAKEIALNFYAKTFDGMAPAEFLCGERSRFKDSSATISATCLAYQFFGHPAMRLVRDPAKDGDANADSAQPKR